MSKQNILIDPLPNSLIVAGKVHPIYSGFRTFILLELLFSDRNVPESNKPFAALELVYKSIPNDLSVAFERLLWFYAGGNVSVPSGPKEGAAQQARRVYDFDQDDAYIYAAFLQQYGIDLNSVEDFHWWKFKALFRGLSGDCEFVKIMEYRAMDVRKIKDKEQRRHYARLQAQYALRENLSDEDKVRRAGAILAGGLAGK